MSDGPGKPSLRRSVPANAQADAMLARALAVVASRSSISRGSLDEASLRGLEVAILSFDRRARQSAVAQMLAAGIDRADIVDHYIPTAARRLGVMWCEDEVGFADVTIGTARLQALLREIEPDWYGHPTTDPLAANVILAVRRDDCHTLGAMVAAAQLRRHGISTRLAVGCDDHEIAQIIATRRFDAIFLSASSSEKLESVRNLVKNIRNAVRYEAPIVVGGSILATDRDVRSFTGADHATADTREALRLCGLKTHFHAAVASATGT